MAERAVLKRGKTKPAKRASARKTAKPRRRTAKRGSKRGAKRRASPILLPLGVAGLAAAALGAAWLYGLPDRLWYASANLVANAGFAVDDVEVRGADRLQRLPVYTAALDGASDSMLLVDLDTVRGRLEALPWVENASVSRALPNRLIIDIDERVPAAIWQNDGGYRLIDRNGHVLQTTGLEAFTGLPFIVDDGANEEVEPLLALLGDFPAVEEALYAATWRGERRWDFELRTGERLLLPEGEDAARAALANFTRIDRSTGLTGRGFATIDFRVPDQMVIRVSREPGAGFDTLDATEI
ncbi:MAG: cell division protein FtsQ/DivIB [Pacificimonas sp.]|jgi:cell division protein FtsQ|nr:cell division protein FtsQ/DivIB [Pacificimonas sp.]